MCHLGLVPHHDVLADHPPHFPDQVPGVVSHQGVGLKGSSGASSHPCVSSESGETPSSTTLHRLIPRSITSPKLCLVVQCFFLISKHRIRFCTQIQHQDTNLCRNSSVLNNFLTELTRSRLSWPLTSLKEAIPYSCYLRNSMAFLTRKNILPPAFLMMSLFQNQAFGKQCLPVTEESLGVLIHRLQRQLVLRDLPHHLQDCPLGG